MPHITNTTLTDNAQDVLNSTPFVYFLLFSIIALSCGITICRCLLPDSCATKKKNPELTPLLNEKNNTMQSETHLPNGAALENPTRQINHSMNLR
jgi:hypothetical protein